MNIIYQPQLPIPPEIISQAYKKSIIFDKPQFIMGYVINIYDSVNFDIGFYEPDYYIMKLISNAKSSIYYFDQYQNYNMTKKNTVGYVYRCRIFKIEVIKNKLPNRYKIAPFIKNIKNKIDILDGWVLCKLRGIDCHQRILFDLILPYKNYFIDFKTILLKKNYFRIKDYS